jgi:hypothetical protein
MDWEASFSKVLAGSKFLEGYMQSRAGEVPWVPRKVPKYLPIGWSPFKLPSMLTSTLVPR